jgi:hypothetical protein
VGGEGLAEERCFDKGEVAGVHGQPPFGRAAFPQPQGCRFIGDRTGWPIVARTAFWSGRHPALLAPSPVTPGEAVTRHIPQSTHCIALRHALPGHAAQCRLGICGQPLPGPLAPTVRQTVGLPTTSQAHHRPKDGAILFSLGTRRRVPCRMTRPHRGIPRLAPTPGVEQERSGQIAS